MYYLAPIPLLCDSFKWGKVGVGRGIGGGGGCLQLKRKQKNTNLKGLWEKGIVCIKKWKTIELVAHIQVDPPPVMS